MNAYSVNVQLLNNDCLIALKTLADNSVDSVVTDPPYGLNFMGKGVVLDPFLGSGTTALACIDCGNDFIGIEKK